MSDRFDEPVEVELAMTHRGIPGVTFTLVLSPLPHLVNGKPTVCFVDLDGRKIIVSVLLAGHRVEDAIDAGVKVAGTRLRPESTSRKRQWPRRQ